jgi:hypothetical protein
MSRFFLRNAHMAQYHHPFAAHLHHCVRRWWGMTAATSSTAPWCPPGSRDSRLDARELSKGGGTFLPRLASTQETSAVLRYRGNRIELLYSSAAFEGLLAETNDVQGEFERLWPGRTVVVDWAGQVRHG